ncbi:AsmA family protein [bacterium]|nr:AsmA family protein [bacterium]
MRLLVNVALLLAAFVVIFVLAVLFFLPTERIARIATDQVRQATGRTLTIGGDISPSFFPVIGVSTGPVTLSNADWAEAPEMLTAASADIGVELLPLMSGRIRISRLHLADPLINLEIDADGRPNWEFEPPATDEDEGAAPETETPTEEQDPLAFLRTFALDEAQVENGAVNFVDRSKGQNIALSQINLTTAFPGVDEEFTAKGTAVWNGMPAALDMQLDSPGDLLAGRRLTLVATVKLEDALASYSGHVQRQAEDAPLRLEGTFDLEAPDPAVLWARLGVAGLPEEIAELTDVDLNGEATVSGGRANVKFDGDLVFRNQQIRVRAATNGAANISAGDRISFRVEASAGAFFSAEAYGDAVMTGSLPEQVDGRLTLTAADPAALAKWAKVAAPPELAEIENLSVIVDLDTMADGIELRLSGGGERGGARMTVTGDATGGPDWREGGRFVFDADAAAEGLFTLSARDGKLSPEGPEIRAAMTFDSGNLSRLAEWAGAALDAPEGTMKTLSLAGDLRADPGSAVLRGAEIALDANRAKGDIRADFAGKPTIVADLETSRLDLTAFMGGGDGAAPSAGGGGAETGWSREPIDFSALKALDAEIALSAPGVVLPDFELGETRLTATLRNGALALDIARAQAFGGGIAGAVRIDGNFGDVALDLDIAGVQLRPLLTAFAGTDRIEGTGSFKTSVSARGDSVHAIMNGLSGSGAVDLKDGALIGVNLAAMVRNATGAFQGGGIESTDFSSVTGTFTIRDGVMTNSDLVFLGPLLRVSGAGAVGLGARNINYRMTPKAVASLEGQGGAADLSGLTFPVLITGPWSKPQFAPDLANAIGSLLKDPEGAKKQIESVVEGVKNLDAGSLKGLLGGVLKPADDAPAPAASAPQPNVGAPPPAVESVAETPAPAAATPEPLAATPEAAPATPQPAVETPQPAEEAPQPAEVAPQPAEAQSAPAEETVNSIESAVRPIPKPEYIPPPTPPADAPIEKPAEAPPEPTAEAPAPPPAETPAETPAEIPAEAPAEAPEDDPLGKLIKGLFQQ